jgi:hypothetical protein
MSDSNKNLVMDHRWGPDTKPDWPTDRRSQNNLNLSKQRNQQDVDIIETMVQM